MSDAGESFLLRLRTLSKSGADGRRLLDIADLPVPAGGCVLLSGRNGAGKTTLLKIIAGLEAPDHAEVTYAGVTQPWSRARRRYAREVIYLHQQPYLFDCSVAENVGYGLRAARMRRSDIARRIEQALETAGLSHLAWRNARELSGGEKQRVALTRALALAPRLLLLDEPLASLDEDSRARTLALIRALKAQPISIVLSSHERLSLTSLADYHYALADGTLTLLHGPEASAAAAVVPFRQRAMAGPAGQRAAPEGNE